jgi:adenylate cyclase class 2
MGIEIELKAWVDDPQNAKRRAGSFARYERAFDKRDVYWRSGNSAALFDVRVRDDAAASDDGGKSRAALVTYKAKETRGAVEVNDEREFAVSAAEPFEELLRALGFREFIRKRKTGWAWTVADAANRPPVLIELCRVEGLGWFAELEIIAERDDPETVAASRERLLDCLARLGVAEERIETRYYTDMLKERDASALAESAV